MEILIIILLIILICLWVSYYKKANGIETKTDETDYTIVTGERPHTSEDNISEQKHSEVLNPYTSENKLGKSDNDITDDTSLKTWDNQDFHEQNQRKAKQELDSIVKFIWPEAEYSIFLYISENELTQIMYRFNPYKDLYSKYEHLLADYPKGLSKRQTIWIINAVKDMFRCAKTELYCDDDSIIEEYKYICSPTHIQRIFFEYAKEYPKLVAAMAAWSVFQYDNQNLTSMLSQYQFMGEAERQVFVHQLIESLNNLIREESMKKTRKAFWKRSLEEIKEIYDKLQVYLQPVASKDADDETEKNRHMVLQFFKQGYDEKEMLKELEEYVNHKQEERNRIKEAKNLINPNNKEEREITDVDRSVLLQQIGHVRWKYNVTSKDLRDQTYIRRNIQTITHIDWDEVDSLIQGEDLHLSDQMKLFKDAISQLRKYRIWNEFDSTCPNEIEVYYKYPDGKSGDINRGLALCYGVNQPEQIDALTWKVTINPIQHHDIIDLMVNGELGVINNREESESIQSKPQAQFLIKYNNYDKLRSMTSSVYSGEPITQGPYFSKASSIQSNYFHQLNDTRNLFYQDLIVTTGTSSKWKSEQKVYAIVRYDYPDAVYQYHDNWLGAQSLDVFIPSLSIGIEYQGLQHYEPVEIFGGEEGFVRVVERDDRKRELCRKNSVKLIYWKYDEPITSDMFHEKINLIIDNEESI